MSVADGFDVRRARGGVGRRGRADTIDDAAQVAVADRFAVLAERDDGAVDLIDLLVNSNLVDEATIGRALAEEAELPYVADVDPNKVSTAINRKDAGLSASPRCSLRATRISRISGIGYEATRQEIR